MEHPHIRGLSGWRPLARSGTSAVWEARQASLERVVAVEVRDATLGPDGQRRFLQAAAAVGRLSGHPGIVTTHDAGVLPDGRPYLVTEVCPGGSLERWLEPGRRPGEEQVRDVGVRVADVRAHVPPLLRARQGSAPDVRRRTRCPRGAGTRRV